MPSVNISFDNSKWKNTITTPESTNEDKQEEGLSSLFFFKKGNDVGFGKYTKDDAGEIVFVYVSTEGNTVGALKTLSISLEPGTPDLQITKTLPADPVYIGQPVYAPYFRAVIQHPVTDIQIGVPHTLSCGESMLLETPELPYPETILLYELYEEELSEFPSLTFELYSTEAESLFILDRLEMERQIEKKSLVVLSEVSKCHYFLIHYVGSDGVQYYTWSGQGFSLTTEKKSKSWGKNQQLIDIVGTLSAMWPDDVDSLEKDYFTEISRTCIENYNLREGFDSHRMVI